MSVGQNDIEHPVKVAKVPSAQIVYKPTEVKKLVEPIVDTANLLFIDRDPDEEIEEAKNGKYVVVRFECKNCLFSQLEDSWDKNFQYSNFWLFDSMLF